MQVTATASDNVGVSKVEFFIDNVLVGTDSASPYAYTWNSAAATNGTHVLVAKAHDTAGNTATSGSTTVTVTGGISDTTPAHREHHLPHRGRHRGRRRHRHRGGFG